MIWAWGGALAVGLSLGLLGSGGAILTVPILVYLVGHDEKVAIVESLAIVGVIAAVGAVRAIASRRADLRSGVLLAVPGIAGTTLGAALARQVPGAVQLAMLAGLMGVAAAMMLRGRRNVPESAPPSQGDSRAAMVVLQGGGLGVVTGLVGVGGGFLIVPLLVLLRGLPMSAAVGTSLFIIAVNSAAGLVAHLAASSAAAGGVGASVDWGVVGLFAGLGVAGSLIGSHVAGRMPQDTLRRLFAVFLIAMAGYILLRQAPRVWPGLFGTGG